MRNYSMIERVIGQVVADKAALHGQRTFMQFEDRKISYHDLDLLSNSIANGLTQMGVGKSTHVALMLDNKPEIILLYVALGKLGAVSVPINTAAKGDLLTYYLRQSDSEMVIADATLVDIEAAAQTAHSIGALLVVDNTFATPFFQRPLEFGAEIVVHSTTKYLGGHSDVIGGAAVVNDDELYARLKFIQNAAGGVPGPFDSWLVLRGIKTLALRMKAHEAGALKVARFLTDRPGVEAVVYPGLPDYPQADLARRQMSGMGGMVVFSLQGGHQAADAFVRALKVFTFAESLGGVESLACHPATMTHASMPEEERLRRGIMPGTIRLSVGIEDPEDLLEDLERALSEIE